MFHGQSLDGSLVAMAQNEQAASKLEEPLDVIEERRTKTLGAMKASW
jgi:hypothetical protein